MFSFHNVLNLLRILTAKSKLKDISTHNMATEYQLLLNLHLFDYPLDAAPTREEAISRQPESKCSEIRKHAGLKAPSPVVNVVLEEKEIIKKILYIKYKLIKQKTDVVHLNFWKCLALIHHLKSFFLNIFYFFRITKFHN